MNPKLPLSGRIYILTVGSVLTTNVSEISLCQLLFRATLKVSCSVTTLGMDNFDCTKMRMYILKNSQLVYGRGFIQEWNQALLAPPLPLMLLNNSRLCSTHKHSSHFFSTAS